LDLKVTKSPSAAVLRGSLMDSRERDVVLINIDQLLAIMVLAALVMVRMDDLPGMNCL